MSNLGTLTLDVNANTGPFTQKLKRAKTETHGFSRAIRGNAGGAMRSMARGMTSLGKAAGRLTLKMGALGAAAAAGLAVFSIKAAADLESTTVAFRTMLGSAQKADKVVSGLFDFSTKTPFEPDEVFAAGRRLLATGTGTGELHGELRTLGDIAAGSNSELADIVDIYSKIKTKGKASMEELNRLSERGININKVLGESLGKTGEEISKMVTQGKIKLPEIQAAFEKLTSEGGMFFDAMSAQSKTLNGLFSTLKGNIKKAAAEFGTVLTKTTNLKNVVKEISDAIADVDWKAFGETSSEGFSALLISMQAIVKGVGFAVAGFENLQAAIVRTQLAGAKLAESTDPTGGYLSGLMPFGMVGSTASDLVASSEATLKELEAKRAKSRAALIKLEEAMQKAVDASLAPPPPARKLNIERIEAERVKTLRHDKPMPETPSDARVVGLLDKILAELKNPNIGVQRPS